MTVRVILFDLMDTVIVDPYRAAIRAATGMPLEELRRRRDPTAWPDFELARIDEATFAQRFFADDAHFDLAAFHRARRAGYRWVDGFPGLLDELAGRAERHAASNYPVWIDELRARFSLDARFEGIWASHHLGARKPDPAFYERLLECARADAGETLFVDDRERNCAGAEEAGLEAHLFTDASTLRARLAADGLMAGT